MKRRAFVQRVSAATATAALAGRASFAWSAPAHGRRVMRLDDGWRFRRDETPGAERPGFDDSPWTPVALPHTARVEALVTGSPGSPEFQWQGICWYRRRLRIEPEDAGGQVLLRFDGAMNVARVWLDGEPLGEHLGGYLPFVFDVSDRVRPGRDHLLAVRLDNRDHPITGPKPLADLDFNTTAGCIARCG